ncbi:agmatine deiminase family protein [Thiocapsa bogorovii]|uniref:agmatine deiminase family protein n=1 Tax=Thiocapsa bogorovii TaxID=521689 RepID=UPI001E39B6C3|nr:agmatine deiminase family protein [Thiocapsa bogorovii]UHD17063.1 agmatine deiminase family protein [Thiocapsa bogorovii]
MRRFPAEWEPQSGVMLTWPHEDTDWADQLDRVERLYTDLAALIGRYEPLLNVCRNAEHAAAIRARLATAGADTDSQRFGVAPGNDTWARDHGPIGVRTESGERLLLDFRFNGWGGKFAADRDDRITETLSAGGLFGETAREPVDLVLEGGAIETDGRGTLLAVTRTLADPRRNPGLTRDAIERILAERLGIRRFLWLEHGAISGDDTDGHIDTLVRFCAPDTLCYARCTDPTDADFDALQAMEQELRGFRDPQGSPYRLVPLPTPDPILDGDGERLPAGYANFLLINGAVLVPTYDTLADTEALDIFRRLFPDRAVLPVDCRPLIRQGGSLHCISMQLMEGVLA